VILFIFLASQQIQGLNKAINKYLNKQICIHADNLGLLHLYVNG
jgi:hypothetical protein